MKITLKKLISTVLAVILMLSAVPFTASAIASGTCGDNVTWTYDESTGELSITGTGAVYDYDYDNRPWEEFADSIKSVVVNGVTSIGECVFSDCDSLASVTIGDSVTTIGNSAFNCCDSITSVTIPDSVTTIGDWAFRACLRLKSVTIGKNVTTIGDYTFYYCYNLISIIIPDSVTTIGDYAFCGCDSLTNVTIGNSVTTIGDWAFNGCGSLTSITIPNSVTTIGDEAFFCCTSLTNITVGADNQYYSSDSYGVLYNKNKTELIQYPVGNERTSYTIPDSVITIGNSAFDNCTSLTSVTIPDSVTTIGDGAFYNCVSLTDVYYNDTEKEWNKISIYEGNEELLNATIHFLGEGEHSHSYSHIVVPSTCKEAGYEYDKCSACGDEVNYVDLPLADHSHNHITVPSTCKVQGMEYDLCTVCGATANSKVLPLANHSLVHYSKPSTCKEQGYEYDKCSACGDEVNYVDLPLADHSYNHITVPSTCKVQGMEYDLCTGCGKTVNSRVLTLAEHSWGEWTVTREATVESTGLEQRTCSACGDVESREIPKLEVIKDEETGVEIVYGDEYESGVEVEVTPVYDGNSYQIIESNYGNVNSKIFDISTIKEGQKVQPDGKVKVRIPVPADFNGNNIFVCYVDSVNGTVENIPATVKDGYIEFEAEHFSYYAILQMLGKVNSVEIDDISMNYKDSATITPNISYDEGVKYTVTYSSSDTDVATVDENGNIYATGKGDATITCTVTDEYGNVVTDTCEVEVKYTFGQWLIIIILFGWIWYI